MLVGKKGGFQGSPQLISQRHKLVPMRRGIRNLREHWRGMQGRPQGHRKIYCRVPDEAKLRKGQETTQKNNLLCALEKKGGKTSLTGCHGRTGREKAKKGKLKEEERGTNGAV